jgi:hypothetical protein
VNIAQWLGSGAAIVVIGICWLIHKHMDKLPQLTHPWIHRLLIALMFCAGATLVVTAAGSYVLNGLGWLGGLVGGFAYPGLGWAVLVCAAAYLLLAVVAHLVWSPDWKVAWKASALPVVLALCTGGVLHTIFVTTVSPAQSVTEIFAHWLGG